jgi:hypothetical protein
MVNPMFEPAARGFEVSYLQAIAAHYLNWKGNPRITVAATARALGRPSQTLHDAINAAEEYYGSPLFETTNGGRRRGRLTQFGQMVGALALHFTAADYLLRNGADVAGLGQFWTDQFIDDIERLKTAGFYKIASLIGSPGAYFPPDGELDTDDGIISD